MNNRIRMLRKESGLTMKQLGEIVGIAENVVSRYETGKRQPDLETQAAIASYFHVTIGYLMGVEDVQDTIPVTTEEQKGNQNDPVRVEAMQVFDDIPESKKQAALDYLKFLASQK